ncbi:hypothetical protein CEXT_209641 [Caerostris extrusa]|uniref:RNase H type-1 domain-containing protein n=1 Tax=Caerostris extrusa TaxID=172846 RepID=A0AAV4PJD6_CAEEX|nr:hypothetical protein CEXT_209641 [Caerostris extrusa]
MFKNNKTTTEIFTDGSKLEEKVGAAFVAYENKQEIFHWKAQLQRHNSVFQAEAAAIHNAINSALSNNKVNVKIFFGQPIFNPNNQPFSQHRQPDPTNKKCHSINNQPKNSTSHG